MALSTVTRSALRDNIAGLVNDRIVTGTATGGSASTLVDTANLVFANDDAINGAWVYINGGTGSGQERRISDFVASTNTLTVSPNWTTNPSTDSTYEIHRKFRVADYNDAINQALQAGRWAFLAPERRTSLLTNCNLLNPLFTDWNSAGTLPDDWTNSSNEVSQSVIDPAGGISYTQVYYAVVYSLGTDIYFEVTDGATTVTDTHDGNGWDLLECQITAAGAVTVAIGVTGASSLTLSKDTGSHVRGPYGMKITPDSGTGGTVDSVYAPTRHVQFEYPLPSDFDSVHAVYMDEGSVGASEPGIPLRSKKLISTLWTIAGSNVNPSPALILRSGKLTGYGVPGNRAVAIEGMAAPADITSDATTLVVNPEVVELYAGYRLQLRTDRAESQHLKQQYDMLKAETAVAWPANSRLVDPN